MKIRKSDRGKRKSYFLGLGTGILITTLVLYLIPIITVKANTVVLKNPLISNLFVSPTPDVQKEVDSITKSVLPQQVDLGVSLGETIVKMVTVGAIDKDKFLQLYQGRGQLSDSQLTLAIRTFQ